jgi:isocitrate dehydrogenase
MLVYIGQSVVAEKVHNAWLRTMEDGVHTYDLFKEGTSSEKVGTSAFADAVIARIGQNPTKLKTVVYKKGDNARIQGLASPTVPAKKEIVGVDIFLQWTGDKRDPNVLGKQLEAFTSSSFKLQMITNRGLKVYPNGHPETFCTDHWRCRFTSESMSEAGSYADVLSLSTQVSKAGFDIIKTENLCTFNGEKKFSMGQGQ